MAGKSRKDLILADLKKNICDNGLNYCITPNGITSAPNLKAWLKNSGDLEGITVEADGKDSALLKVEGYVYKIVKNKEGKWVHWDIVYVRKEYTGLTALNENLSDSLNEEDRGVGLCAVTDLKAWVDENKDALYEVDDLTYEGESATFTSEGKPYRIIKEELDPEEGYRWAVIDSLGKLEQKPSESDHDYLNRYMKRQLNFKYVGDSFILVIDLRKGLYKEDLKANNINLLSLTESTATIEYKGNNYSIVNIGEGGAYSWVVQTA